MVLPIKIVRIDRDGDGKDDVDIFCHYLAKLAESMTQPLCTRSEGLRWDSASQSVVVKPEVLIPSADLPKMPALRGLILELLNQNF